MGGQWQRSDSADGNEILIITIQATKCLAKLTTFCGLIVIIETLFPSALSLRCHWPPIF